MNTATVDVVAPSGFMFAIQLMVKPAIPIVSLQKGEYFCFHSSLCICLYRCIYDYVTVCVTIYVNIYRDALIAIHPNIQTLMCYFHVVNCCKKIAR